MHLQGASWSRVKGPAGCQSAALSPDRASFVTREDIIQSVLEVIGAEKKKASGVLLSPCGISGPVSRIYWAYDPDFPGRDGLTVPSPGNWNGSGEGTATPPFGGDSL